MKYLLKICKDDKKTMKVYDVEDKNEIMNHIPEECSFSLNTLISSIETIEQIIAYRKQSLKSIQDEINMYKKELNELYELNET